LKRGKNKKSRERRELTLTKIVVGPKRKINGKNRTSSGAATVLPYLRLHMLYGGDQTETRETNISFY
jgi:hypothetical protein